MDKWDKLRKVDRNKLLVAYAEKHPEVSLREIGKIFGISRQRAWEILQNDKNRKATEQVPVA